jgi:biopolymer transport protein ExbD
MAKIKMKKSTPRIDMTPMVDMFSLLLTFFILTAQFRPQESVTVDTPSSISETPAPEGYQISLTIDPNSQVYFNVQGGMDTSEHIRAKVLQEVANYYGLEFTQDEIDKFEALSASSFSLPVKNLKDWINADNMADRDQYNSGLPMDSTNNELNMWIRSSRQAKQDLSVVIKGDADADYKVVRRVIDVLQDNNVNRFDLVTTVESAGEVTLDENL